MLEPGEGDQWPTGGVRAEVGGGWLQGLSPHPAGRV
jgi:hypothetical protein